MIWLMWRQHRTDIFVMSGVIVVLVFIFILTGIGIHDSYQQLAISLCLHPNPSAACQISIGTFYDTNSDNNLVLGLILPAVLNFFPIVVGMLLAAPLIAREVEMGTHQLIWTQGVTRQRWLTFKLLGILGICVLASGVLTAVYMWWRSPLDAILGHLIPIGVYDLEGIVPLGYITFSVALALAAGAFLRRTIAAMVAALLLFLLTRVSLASLRYSWLPTQTITWDPLNQSNPNIYHGDWIVQNGWVDVKGHTLSTILVNNTCLGNPQCTHQHQWLQYMIVQPAEHFWTLQAIETSIFLVLAAALVMFTYWLVSHRVSE